MIADNGEASKGPAYPVPWRLLCHVVCSAARGGQRSFALDSQKATALLQPKLRVLGGDHVPRTGPCLIVCNHYSRPGFAAWWTGFAISSAVAERRAGASTSSIRWVMTAAWTFPESRWKRRLLTPLTRWAFERVARVYDFVTMPPMPPDPREVHARAMAVRRTLRLVQESGGDGPLIGLAPEGQDTPGRLGEPPKGAGSFIALLVQAGLPVLPSGLWELGGQLQVSFGPMFVPSIPTERQKRDAHVARQVMEAIGRQLPT
jgi:1-acyl-sn-glycerol-3-phosphate acyltransferase